MTLPNSGTEISHTDLHGLRIAMRQKRNALSAETQQRHAKQAALHFSDAFKEQLQRPGLRIAIYNAVAGELDPFPLTKQPFSSHCEFFLPIISGKQLQFGSINDAQLSNRFGIDEPATAEAGRIMANEIDIVVTPLLAYDLYGNRLGMGGGYYDQTFADVKPRKPLKIGYAHSLQGVSKLATHSWDIPLDAIVNERHSQLFELPS